MAGSIITTDILEVEAQRKGYLGISLTNWTNTSEPEITLGSIIEIAGAVIEFGANEDIDSGGAWAGFSNNTLVYGYINGTTYVSVLTTTAPTWNTELQGWYDATSQHRYYMTLYKDGSGNYIRKNLLRNIQAIYLKEYAYEKDMYAYSTAGTSVLWTATTNNAVAADVRSTKIFYIRKPISALILTSRVSGDTFSPAYNSNVLYIATHGGYVSLKSTGYQMPIELNPGKYKWLITHGTGGGLNQGVRRHTIYINGMYGGTSITKSACIDT